MQNIKGKKQSLNEIMFNRLSDSKPDSYFCFLIRINVRFICALLANFPHIVTQYTNNKLFSVAVKF